MNIRCHRCDGLLTHDSAWSLTEPYTHLDYVRCINCGNYQFEAGVSGVAGMDAPYAEPHRKRQRHVPYTPST